MLTKHDAIHYSTLVKSFRIALTLNQIYNNTKELGAFRCIFLQNSLSIWFVSITEPLELSLARYYAVIDGVCEGNVAFLCIV